MYETVRVSNPVLFCWFHHSLLAKALVARSEIRFFCCAHPLFPSCIQWGMQEQQAARGEVPTVFFVLQNCSIHWSLPGAVLIKVLSPPPGFHRFDKIMLMKKRIYWTSPPALNFLSSEDFQTSSCNLKTHEIHSTWSDTSCSYRSNNDLLFTRSSPIRGHVC